MSLVKSHFKTTYTQEAECPPQADRPSESTPPNREWWESWHMVGVALDFKGRIWTSLSNGRFRVFDNQGNFLDDIPPFEFVGSQLLFDPDGNLCTNPRGCSIEILHPEGM